MQILFAQEQQSGVTTWDDLIWLVLFGGGALLVLTIMYFLRHQHLNITFARLYGLMVVAVLAVFLAFATELLDEARTAAYALLGTIAGYLAGASPTQATETKDGESVTTSVL